MKEVVGGVRAARGGKEEKKQNSGSECEFFLTLPKHHEIYFGSGETCHTLTSFICMYYQKQV